MVSVVFILLSTSDYPLLCFWGFFNSTVMQNAYANWKLEDNIINDPFV